MARAHTFPTVMGGLLALALTPAFWPGGALAQEDEVEACTDQAADLVLRKGAVVGHINVCNTDTTLTITIQMLTPWFLCKADVHAATIPEDGEEDDNIPQARNGVPNPGRFADGADYDPCVAMDTFPIPLDEIGPELSADDMLAIAVHAEVVDDDERNEGAWGDGTRFVERGPWAMYFTYTLQVPSCNQPGVEGASCLVFVTRQEFLGGELGGLSGADGKCQAEADEAVVPGTYRAWLADDTDSPLGRFTQADVPYELVDGSQVAANFDDLVDGNVAADVIKRLDGTGFCDPSVQGCAVWSAVDVDTGNYLSGAPTCDRWSDQTTAGDEAGATQGVTTSQWADIGDAFCEAEDLDQSHPVICVEQ